MGHSANEVEPFPIRLGNVLVGLCRWSARIAIAVTLVSLGSAALHYIVGDHRSYQPITDALAVAGGTPFFTFLLVWLPCRVLDYLITGRRMRLAAYL